MDHLAPRATLWAMIDFMLIFHTVVYSSYISPGRSRSMPPSLIFNSATVSVFQRPSFSQIVHQIPVRTSSRVCPLDQPADRRCKNTHSLTFFMVA